MQQRAYQQDYLSRAKTQLTETFDFTCYKDGQQRAIDALLNDAGSERSDWRGSALAVFPTGGGKSLLYQLPAVVLNEAGQGTALIVSPLISLMEDQIRFLTSLGVSAARLDSTLSYESTREVETSFQDGTLALLYVSPERFNNERFLSLLESVGASRAGGISLFAVDEAHCISQWGHNFRPDYLKLAALVRDLNVPRVLALTATATPRVAADVARQFAIPELNVIRNGFYRPNLALLTTKVTYEDRDQLLIKRMRSPKRPPGPAIVYTTLQSTAERVAGTLREAGFDAAHYHAGMEASEREKVQSEWTTSPNKTVVATIAFGMGIDKPDVRYVYHYNLSKSLESFAQEIGRAGRDGKHSVVESFFCAEDLPTLENFAYGDTPHFDAVRGLVAEVLSKDGSDADGAAEFSLSLRDLSTRHDIRELVVKTILTYLELDGLIRQGTPFYETYKVRRQQNAFSNTTSSGVSPQDPLQGILDKAFGASEGRWATVEIEDLGHRFDISRREAVRAVDSARESGVVEVKTEGARLGFSRLPAADTAEPATVAERTMEKLRHRERQEIARLYEMAGLLSHEGCQWAALCKRFGDSLREGCGHCTYCAYSRAAEPLKPVAPDPGEHHLVQAIEALGQYRRQYPHALGDDRQAARFLCGVSSPATTRAALNKDAHFGELSGVPFWTVLQALAADETEAPT